MLIANTSSTTPKHCLTVFKPGMNGSLNEQQVDELVNFDYVEQDLADLIDDEQKFDINDYLNSNIDY